MSSLDHEDRPGTRETLIVWVLAWLVGVAGLVVLWLLLLLVLTAFGPGGQA